MIQEFKKIKNVKGELSLPGDKSISHRAVIFSSLAKGTSRIINLLESDDVISTINCFRNLGCEIHKEGTEYLVNGKGYKGFSKPENDLDAGNSGTTARLISGVLAAQDFGSNLVGDESLSKRPMNRIAKPLSLMGTKIKLSDRGTLPAYFQPSDKLKNIDYELEVASAQVKSALLLSAIHIDQKSTIIEKSITRDHTERMLGCETQFDNGKKIITASKKNYPNAQEYLIPSDISTAAFFIVLALLAEGSELIIKNVSLNPTRTGFLILLKEMGANITFEKEKKVSGEELGDIVVKSSSLKNIVINPELIPNIIDEIPILSVAGLFAKGDFVIKNAAELRVKESDRIKSLVYNYQQLGVEVEEFEDGFKISGKIKNKNPKFKSFGDHRIAMTFAILSSLVFDNASIENFECAKISNPDFLNQLKSIANQS